MVYDINGSPLYSAYDKNAIELQSAFDVYGNSLFSVMTYNVGQWYIGSGTNVPSAKDSQYYALQNGMLQNDDADIVFLEEYWKTFSGTGRTAKSILEQYYPYIHEQGGDSGYYGRCICSKYPIDNYTVHTYTNDAQRYYDSCDILFGGTSVTLVITHLSTVSSERIAQLSELLSFLGTLDTFICAGDFNTLDCRSVGGQDYTDIIAPILSQGYHCANCSSFGFLDTYFDQTSPRPNVDGGWAGCLDNIVTSSNISVGSAFVDTTKMTDGLTDKVDHMPLIADLIIN